MNDLTLIAHNDDAMSLQSAVSVSVTSGSTYQISVYGFGGDRGNIALNITTPATGNISGVVTGPDGESPLGDIEVQAYRWGGSWWASASYDYTDPNGHYEVGGLAAGTYRVTFRDWDGNYAGEVYDDIPGNSYYNSGTEIVVGEDSAVSNINASLVIASKITGQVTGPDGLTGLYDVFVAAYSWSGSWWEQTSYTWTDENGDYELGGLAAGVYRVVFNGNGNYVDEVYDDIPGWNVWSYGTEIGVPGASTVPGIDASLDEYASVSGTVTQDDGSTPIPGVLVVLTDEDGQWESSGRTDADGS